MRALIQRVLEASVEVEGETVGKIGPGLCALIGVSHEDDETKARKMADKLWNLRILDDENGQMNKSASELGHPILIVSQFTLYGNTVKGRRPSFIDAARPEQAEPLIDLVVSELEHLGASVETGRFRTEMKVALVNNGPVTLMVEV